MTAIRTFAGDGRKAHSLTRDDVIDALQEYARRFGEDELTAAAFSPSSAKWGGRMDLRDRYYDTTREDGRSWPSLNAIKKLFDGSFNQAREAAGFAANTPGPAKRRRQAGTAEPIRHIREHTVVLASERSREATRRAERAEARLANAQRRIEQLRADLAAAKAARPVVREPRANPKTIQKTITRTVKVKDERALARLREKLADIDAVRRAAVEQARAAVRDRDRALRELESARAESAQAAVLARAARDGADRAGDRLAAAELRVTELQAALRDARAAAIAARHDDDEIAVPELVADAEARADAADARADAAEVRAARAERELAEQAAAIAGEARKLTQAELSELRRAGPAGPAVLGDALKQLGAARHRNHELAAALTQVAQAAITWRDRL